jgi:peptidoglycan/LPS O-acetylase OafA/YrhL
MPDFLIGSLFGSNYGSLRAILSDASRLIYGSGGLGVDSAAPKKVVSIQYLRALAAILVVVQHANSGPIHLDIVRPDLATFGVDLFFVISGYIMWTTTAETSRTPRQFWMARIIRIVPLYWAFTSLYVAITLLHPATLQNPTTDLVFIVKSYAFVPAVHPVAGNISPIYSLGWTLNYEMFFYLIFGIALMVRRGAGRLVVVAAALGALVLAGLEWHPANPILQTYSSELLLEFLSGTLIGAASERLILWGARVAGPLLGVTILWLIAVYFGKLSGDDFVLIGLPAALTVAGLVALERSLRCRPQGWALSIGDASYSLYLSHPFVERALYLALPTVAATANPIIGLFCIAIASSAAIPFAIVIYRVIERPMLAVLRNATNYRTVSATPQIVG